MKYKLLAIDIDETLTDMQKRISPANIDAIHRAKVHGVSVSVVTGRPVKAVKAIWETIKADPLTVCLGGAVIHDFASGENVFENPMSPESVIDALLLARKLGLHAHIYDGDYIVSAENHPQLVSYVNALNLPYKIDAQITEKVWSRVAKVLFIAPLETTSEYARITREHFGSRLWISESSPGFIELNWPTTDKGTGLYHLADNLGISMSEVIAVGDSPLDAPMIQTAGLGVAVANAAESVKAIADVIAPSCNEDAIAWVVDNIVLRDD